MGYNLDSLKVIRSHTTKQGSHWVWIPQSTDTVSMLAFRSIRPQTNEELLSSVFFQDLVQNGSSAAMKEFGKTVRKFQGTLRTFCNPMHVGLLIKTNQQNLLKQFEISQEILTSNKCNQEEFSIHQSDYSYRLNQSCQGAKNKNRLMYRLGSLEVYSPYLRQEKDFLLDVGTLDFKQYNSSFDAMASWPINYVLFGGNEETFSQMVRLQENIEETFEHAPVDRKSSEAHIYRHLSDDPEASHIMSFATDTDVVSQIYMEILFAMLQNMQNSYKVLLSHSFNRSRICFEKDLPITEVPEHMENVWKMISELTNTIPTKEDFNKALYRAKSNIAYRFQDAENLAQHLLQQNGWVIDASFFQKLDEFHHIDVSEWMTFVRGLFDFEKQQVFEVAPEVYGQGASVELRLESLRKRLGFKNEKPQTFLADQYQFETLQLQSSFDAQPQYAHPIPIGDDHHLMVNIVPTETMAHLTVYFDGGRRFEHEKNAGMTQLLAMSVLNGSKEKKEVKKSIESFGVKIDIENSADFFGFHFSMHPSLVSTMLPKITKLIYASDFSQDFVNEQKLQLLKMQSIKAQKPFSRSVELFYQSLFGIHGYGQPRLGNQFSVLNIEYGQLEQAFEQDMKQSSSTLWVLTSPVAHDDVAVELSKNIPSREQKEETRAQLFSMFPKKQLKIAQDLHADQIHSVCMGLKSINIKDHRQYYLDIMQIYLSGTGGMLSDALIEKLNLVDTVKAYHVHLLQAGVFFIQLKSQQVEDESLFEYLQTIFTSFTKVAPAHDALEVAKQLAVLRRKHRLQHHRELSYDIGSRYFAGLGWEDPIQIEQNISKTNPSEMMHVMNELMDFDSFAMGIC